MKIAATTVGTQCPEDSVYNSPRMQAAKQALEKSKKRAAHVLVLPGGYFTADDYQSGQRIANSLVSEAKRLGIAVVFGVDEYNADSVEARLRTKTKAKVQKQTAEWWPDPMYGYAWSPTDNEIHCWRQRSTNSTDQLYVDDKRCKEVRLLMVNNDALSVLICGEIFNESIRNAIRNCEPRPKVVADLGHKGRGYRVSQGMKKLGLASMCSLHVQSRNAAKPVFRPEVGYKSVRGWDEVAEGPPRIEIKLLDF